MIRTPPQSIDAEQSVLGAVMINPQCWPKVAALLSEADFYDNRHRIIWQAIAGLAEQQRPHDAVTMMDWIDAHGMGDAIGGSGYLIDLAQSTPSAANAVAHAKIVADKSGLRRLIDASAQITDAAFEAARPAADIVADAAASLAKIVPTQADGALTPKQSMGRWYRALTERMQSGRELVGLATPWNNLDEVTKGLRPGRLYIIAGRPGMGKSVIGCQLAAYAAMHSGRTALYSLEMTDEECRDRNVASTAEIPYQGLESPSEEAPWWAAVLPAVQDLQAAPLLIDDTPQLTPQQLCYRASALHMEGPLSLVVIDHLHELKVDGKDRVNALGDAARALKALAKNLSIPVVCLAQLNRGNTSRDDKRPTMSDLRASGAIEEVADVVLLLHREDYYNKDTHLQNVIEVIIGKGRNIRSGGSIHLRNRYDIMRADDWIGPLPEAPEPPEKPSRGFQPRVGSRWSKAQRDD